MGDFVLTTDATIDLSGELAAELGIKVIPMHYMLGENEYVHGGEGNSIPLSQFYERLSKGENASTSQITPSKYTDFFEPFLREGKDVIYVALSSGLSGTYSASCVAASGLCDEYPQRKITTIDSVCASIGEGLLVLLAARLKNAGAGYDEVVRYIEETKVKVCHWFEVENLEQLKRGGRISALEAGIGQALKICPVLSTDREGKLRVVKKIRTGKKAIAFIKERLETESESAGHKVVLLAHANDPDYAQSMKEELISEGLCDECIICEVGPVIGSHTGSGMCAMAFLGENYKEY